MFFQTHISATRSGVGVLFILGATLPPVGVSLAEVWGGADWAREFMPKGRMMSGNLGECEEARGNKNPAGRRPCGTRGFDMQN